MTAARRPLWVATYPGAPGSYGVVTAEILPRLKRAGYEVGMYAFWGGPAGPVTWEDVPIFPPIRPGQHSDIVLVHAGYHQADLVITMADPLAVPTGAYRKLFWVAWAPSDSEPVAPANVTALRHAKLIWSMSKHGHDQLTAAGFTPEYVPLSIDTKAFHPVARDVAREAFLGLLREQSPNDMYTLGPDTFVIAFNGANLSRPCRKGFYPLLTAFKRFHDAHPDSILYMHTDPLGASGEPVDRWIDLAGVNPRAVWFPPSYHYLLGFITKEWLAQMYSAADVFVQPSAGEGFGLPIVEAQACGTPVIVNDFSSMGELTFAGWKVTPGAWVPALNWGALHRQADIDGFVYALERAYEARGDQGLRDKARAGALAYDTATVFEQYVQPALEKAYEVYDHTRHVFSGNGRQSHDGDPGSDAATADHPAEPDPARVGD